MRHICFTTNESIKQTQEEHNFFLLNYQRKIIIAHFLTFLFYIVFVVYTYMIFHKNFFIKRQGIFTIKKGDKVNPINNSSYKIKENTMAKSLT